MFDKAAYMKEYRSRPEFKSRRNALARKKYADDPAYRVRLKRKNSAALRKRYLEDPLHRARQLARTKAWLKEKYRTDAEFREKVKRWSREYDSVHYKSDPAYRRKRLAYAAVRYALKRGKLDRGPCEQCGITSNVESHHDDYSKPLDVRWFCSIHHGIVHTRDLERLEAQETVREMRVYHVRK